MTKAAAALGPAQPHLLGWDPGSAGTRAAPEVFDFAVQAYLDIVRQRPRYAEWLATHHQFGAQVAGVA